MKPIVAALLSASLAALAACNNEQQNNTSETVDPNPAVKTNRSPDTGTGGPVPRTPKDGDEQKIQSPSN
ncbi:hypothetical protein DUT91_06790 [Phyllobacterium salinisoli]|uniref:Immunogenic protein (Bcsp31-1) n=1 Tax=Phyllobacterium salinisoli TaxID=1899321 RepID=A0A368K942_9HYPH|nr:hypothetical protein [Phyllobacterium salinisoli]RCS25125.1 hypothetical protein DUT91_06790 [Phyllobacterium salinisoli]